MTLPFNVKRHDYYHDDFEGTYGIYKFDGYICNEPSEDGIAHSRISSLNVYCGEVRFIEYCDTWERGEKYLSIIQPIVEMTQEHLPPIYEDYEPTIIVEEKKKPFWKEWFK